MLTNRTAGKSWSERSFPLRRAISGIIAAALLLSYATFAHAQSSPLTIQPSTSRVGVNTTNPGYPLDVTGTVNASSFRGDGSQLTNLPNGSGNALGGYGSRGQASVNNTTTPTTQYDLKADVVILYKASDQTTVVRHNPALITNITTNAGPRPMDEIKPGPFLRPHGFISTGFGMEHHWRPSQA